jgi:hypothetical protein
MFTKLMSFLKSHLSMVNYLDSGGQFLAPNLTATTTAVTNRG